MPGEFAAFAAEFPNDNSELHLGTIWMCESVCGPAEPHFPEERSERVDELADEAVDDDSGEPIEIVDSIVLEGPIEIVPAPRESGVVALAAGPEEVTETKEQTVLEDERVGVRVIAEESEHTKEPEPRLVSTPPPPITDPFAAFLQTLSDVACDAGQTFAASEIGVALEGDPVALAWRAILNGESEDFSLCATPLDEWASLALARVLSAPHKTGQLRRELRARGVAAFGLVEAA